MLCMSSVIDILNKLRGPIQSVPSANTNVVIRRARPDDAEALATLAQLDSSRAPRGEVIVADVQGELWAAVSVEDGHAVAHPFRPSGELTFGLIERARELHRAGRDKAGRRDAEGIGGFRLSPRRSASARRAASG